MNFQNSIAIEVSLFETIRAKGILQPLGKRRASSKVSTRALEPRPVSRGQSVTDSMVNRVTTNQRFNSPDDRFIETLEMAERGYKN